MIRRVIYKYQFSAVANGELNLSLPEKSRVIHVGKQDELVTLWIEQDNSHLQERREFQIVGTGFETIRINWEHVGTVLMDSGLVWHVYEVLAISSECLLDRY